MTTGIRNQGRPSNLRLRAGDRVEVRSREEILATLDAQGKIDGLPFMPEMLAFCGRSFTVGAVAHKTCDPAHKTGGRRMKDAVHLEGLRCDGSAHGGCQASCLLFWKTSWLRKAGEEAVPPTARQPIARISAEQLSSLAVSQEPGQEPVYSCQATCMYSATELLHWWDPRQYVWDVTSGNVSPGVAARLLALSWVRSLLRIGIGYRLFRRIYDVAHRCLMGSEAPDRTKQPRASMPSMAPGSGLAPSEMVVVKPLAEIQATLGPNGKNRGLWFDTEMTVFCERPFLVERRVEAIIDEVSGKMLRMKTPCITLKGVYCKGLYSQHRLFCPRAITPYWREVWLERISGR